MRQRRPEVVAIPGEIWKPIVGFENVYECSNMGRFRSLDRFVQFFQVNGKSGRLEERRRFCQGQIVRTYKAGPERQRNFIDLACGEGGAEREKHIAARLIYETHVGPLKGDGYWVCHKNRNWGDDRAANLVQLPIAEAELLRDMTHMTERQMATRHRHKKEREMRL